MGCDIHWILERRHPDGIWEATYSKSRFYSCDHDWKTPYGKGSWTSPAMILANRDYNLFAALSEVRGNAGPNGPIAFPGLPEDASSHARQAFGEDIDLHSHGWIPGTTLLRLAQPRARKAVRGFAKSAVALLTTPEALREILPPYVIDPNNGRTFADLAGAESQHQRLERARRATELLPVSDPKAWRLLIAYDN
jgi:hypothetical protein